MTVALSCPFPFPWSGERLVNQLQPVVEPQVLHFMQVPLRTRVKLPQEPHESPSKPFIRASAARLARLLPPSAVSRLANCAETAFPNSACTLAPMALTSSISASLSKPSSPPDSKCG